MHLGGDVAILYLAGFFMFTLGTAKFMGIFFDNRRGKAWAQLGAYGLFYVGLAVLFLLFNVILVSTIVGITATLILTLTYEGTFKKRVIITMCHFAFTTIVELFAYGVTVGYTATFTSHLGTDNRLTFVLYGILGYILPTLLQKFKNIKKGVKIHPLQITATIAIPVSSIFIIFAISSVENISQVILAIVIILLLGINLLTIYLFDTLSAAYEEKLAAAFHTKEKEHYLAQCQLMVDAVDKMKLFRHDAKLHFATIDSLAAQNNMAAIKDYLATLSTYVKSTEIYCETGSISFDSIVNYKLREANEKGITIKFKPSALPPDTIHIMDMTTIVGNILDNALTALEDVPNKWIKLQAIYQKGALMIDIANPYKGNLRTHNGIIQTTKQDQSNHGYGLKSVKATVEKYKGTVNITHDKEVFRVQVVIFCG